ncbi:MAG: hypothetical protein H0Z35_11530 [Thermoanaerobacteraceae bacterium]|nr:hypothetical protein [Thermoanaerobacteraceae bacterium]
MRKLSLLLVISLLVVIAFAGVAFAEQAKYKTVYDSDGDGNVDSFKASYSSTTVPTTYDDTNLERLIPENKFNPDGVTNYPYEIYLPNEKDPAKYRIHTNYTKDTDACASCHATHTAVGKSLLQWYTVYDTCMACHDGTVTTTYNVWGGEIGTTEQPTFGGMFGGTESASSHNVVGTVTIGAAPGGSIVEEIVITEAGEEIKRWSDEFGCESCHTPHGQGGNARILHPDPNGWATKNKPKEGFEYKGTLTDAPGTGFYDTGAGYVVYQNGEAKQLIVGYPYDPVIVDKTTGEPIEGVTIDNSKGYSVLNGLTTNARVYATPALKVTMNITNYLGKVGSDKKEQVEHLSGMNTYCGACHTDYNTEDVEKSGSNLSGTYSQAYRHKMGESARIGIRNYENLPDFRAANMRMESGKLYCLTCHVAHGTSKDYWERTIGDQGGTNAFADSQLVEISGSSALKRAPNMGTCEACHDKSSQNEGYAENTGTQNKVTLVVGTSDKGGTFSSVGAEFVGKEACAECHADYVESFNQTAHANMLSLTTAAEKSSWAEQLGFTDADNDGIKERTYENGMTFTEDDLVLNLNAKKDGVVAVGPDDKLYILAEAGEEFAEPEQYGCVGCHVTPKDSFGGPDYTWTEFKAALDNGEMELGIQCEDCHGSGSKHVQTPSEKNILNPADFSMQDQSNDSTVGCGRCHGKRHHQGEFWQAISVDWNNSHEEEEWEKGLVGPSAHYISGAVSCATCHDAHAVMEDVSRDGKQKEVQLKMEVRSLCNACHGDVLSTAEDFDKQLPLKINGMPGHLFDGNGLPEGADYEVEHEHGVIE